ncbi:biotin transporter BioY [Microbacterium sp. bgisy189]|uniref:biotin transporter BioY n=1 Tax=Microbacterium sp. bgisy189 TaxID=3413798 RepID=UPI003EBD780A
MPTTSTRGLDATAIARVAVFAALIAVLGLLGAFTVFGAVPITAQTLGVMLAGAILGPWLGAASVAVVLALVAAGLPLLAGGRGGIGVFVGPTAGYLAGWLAGVIVIGLIVRHRGRIPTPVRTVVGVLTGGILVIYLFGIPVQSLVMRLPLGETALSSLVFLPGDLIKAVIASVVVLTLVRAYPRAFRRETIADAAETEERDPVRV